jgi:hypothetical protein
MVHTILKVFIIDRNLKFKYRYSILDYTFHCFAIPASLFYNIKIMRCSREGIQVPFSASTADRTIAMKAQSDGIHQEIGVPFPRQLITADVAPKHAAVF